MKTHNDKPRAHRWLYESESQIEAVALAECGLSLAAIADVTGISKGRLSYGLTRAKNLDGLPKGVGYITQYRSGRSELARMVVEQYLPHLKKEASSVLPRLVRAKRVKATQGNNRQRT